MDGDGIQQKQVCWYMYASKSKYCNATIFCVLYFVNFTTAYAISKLGVALLVGVYGSNKRTNLIIDVDFRELPPQT